MSMKKLFVAVLIGCAMSANLLAVDRLISSENVGNYEVCLDLQRELRTELLGQGFSPLAAAIFLGLNVENVCALLEEAEWGDMLVIPVCQQASAAESGFFNALAKRILPLTISFFGNDSVGKRHMFKWLSRRNSMWSYRNRLTGMHFVFMAGDPRLFDCINPEFVKNFIEEVEEFRRELEAAKREVARIEASQKWPMLGVAAKVSQSQEMCDWLVRQNVLKQEGQRDFRVRTMGDDLSALPQDVVREYLGLGFTLNIWDFDDSSCCDYC